MLLYRTIALYFSNLLLMFLLAICSHLHVYHLSGALIPGIWVGLVVNLCEFIRLSIRNLLILIRINTHVIMWPFLTVCHPGMDNEFMCFCMSSENRPQLLCTSLYKFNSKTILFHIKQRFF